MIERAIFPLHTIVYPKSCMPLRVFEPRYLDMISECLKNSEGFVIVCIKEGAEVGPGAKVVDMGTECNIKNFQQLPDNLLSVLAEGANKVRLLNRWQEKNGLMKAHVEVVEDDEDCMVADRYVSLVNMLKEIINHPDNQLDDISVDFNSSHSVGYRLAEFLPIPLVTKQSLLEIQQPNERLEKISQILGRLEYTLTA